MSGLAYVGVDPATTRDTENRINADAALNAGVSRTYVQGRVHDLALPYATKLYVDTKDAAYASETYFPAQDALLIPKTARGVASGIASLVNAKIPPEQIPVLGAGILKGPYPPTHTYSGNTFDIPLKIADWQLGITAIACQPWAFMSVMIVSNGGRPVVEVKAGTPAQTTYAAQTLVAYGYGRNYYNDYQTVEVIPTDPDLNEGQDGVQDFWAATTDMVLTAWMRDDQGGQVTTSAGFIYTASVFLARTAL